MILKALVHGFILGKVRGRGASPEGRAVLYSVDEGLVNGSELRCAKEWLCMTEEA